MEILPKRKQGSPVITEISVFNKLEFQKIIMVYYTNYEYVDMLLILGKCDGNSKAAVRRYTDKFPNRTIPNWKTFLSVRRRLCETGSLKPRVVDRGRRRTARNPNIEEHVLNIIEDNPTISTRRLSRQVGSNHQTVWRIAKEQQLHPYHFRQVQDLLPQDLLMRAQFCQWLLNRHQLEPNFLSNIIFTDEATFTRNGVFNMHNEHFWANENPNAKKVTHYQHSFKVNVWAATLGSELLSFYILPGNLTGEMYYRFLSERIYDFLEDIPLARRQLLWYMHDGAPPHYAIRCRQWLTQNFPNRWIGRGYDAPRNWPPRSPDLNPLDFSVWGQVKDQVYAQEITSEQQLIRRIENCFNEIQQEGKLNGIIFSLIKRLRLCLAVNGDHFEK